MCSKEDVKKLLDERDLIRDKNIEEREECRNKALDDRFFDLKEMLFLHTESILAHCTTSPPTKIELDKIIEKLESLSSIKADKKKLNNVEKFIFWSFGSTFFVLVGIIFVISYLLLKTINY
jgi:hypothetical protein